MLLTELPVYLYHNAELPHRGDGALFHYTKFSSFLKIMEDMTLLPSSFGNLNDMNEGNVSNMNMNENFMVMYNAIVIDKEAFIKKNKAILDSHFYKFEDVEYSLFNTPKDTEINYEANTPEEFIMNNWKALFFLKHNDWINEDEHRLFLMDYDGKLSIDGCIKYVVLGRKVFLDDSRIKTIMDMVIDPKSGCYRKFVPHSFATMCYDNHGYSTMEIAFKIDMVVRANLSNGRYVDYLSWLKEEQGYS